MVLLKTEENALLFISYTQNSEDVEFRFEISSDNLAYHASLEDLVDYIFSELTDRGCNIDSDDFADITEFCRKHLGWNYH